MKDLRNDLKAIYTAAIAAANPGEAVRRYLFRRGDAIVLLSENGSELSFNLAGTRRVYVIGAGKATAPMASAVEELLGGRITKGLIAVKHGHTAPLQRIETVEATHPVPGEEGMGAAKRISAILDGAGADDLVISLISGGGSSLLPLVPVGITLADKQAVTKLLLSCGASIGEINAVRKHLSLVKGGNLARRAYPATVVNLMISDVVGDDIGVIASGPFSPDPSTFADALGVIDRYGLRSAVPSPVIERLEKGAGGLIEENPGPGDPVFASVHHRVIASNALSLDAARHVAEARGYHTLLLSSSIEGDTGAAARQHVRLLKEITGSEKPVPLPACVISGGETTVVVRGDGLGGRNMEFAMRAAGMIEGMRGVIVASVGTDGTDGPTDAAGALADGMTVARARERGADIGDFIARNDSYHFFERIGDLIITGPTNTNVMDVRIMLADDPGARHP